MNLLRIPTGRKQISRLLKSYGRGVELGTTENKFSGGRVDKIFREHYSRSFFITCIKMNLKCKFVHDC